MVTDTKALGNDDRTVLVHRRGTSDRSTINGYTKLRIDEFLCNNMFPMTLNWVLENYPNTKNHIPTSTYKQILEDLAHAAR